MRAPALLAAALATAGCMMDVTPRAANPCDAAGAMAFVGRPADEADAARIASGAKIVRTIRPDHIVTTEYRVDRLNVEVDEAGIIRALRCG